MSYIERLRLEHGAALLAFERANRAYFAASVPDRGDDYFTHFDQRLRDLLAEQAIGVCHFHVLVGDNGEVLGRVNLVDVADGEAEVGFRIAEKAAGQGLATAAVREVCALAREKYGLTSLRAAAAVDNVASRTVLSRAGFVPTGEEVLLDGQTGLRYLMRLETSDHLARVAAGWDGAVDGYDAYFVPRFAPWLRMAVTAVSPVPAGPIIVPCCGTFPELDLLLQHFPDHEITGIDLSAGMVRRARERAGGRARVIHGDATTLEPGRYAAVVSVFGLQQLPDPETAIRSWTAALAPGGRLSVVYWPGTIERDGPFALMREVLNTGTGYDWEGRLRSAIQAAGATVERDEEPQHPMTHADAATMVDAYIHSGPLRAMALARGDAFMARVREEFLRRAPAGEWTHHPRARLLVARMAAT